MIRHAAGELSGEVDGVELEDAPLRMALSPLALVLALGKGGLQQLNIQLRPEGPPLLSPTTGMARAVQPPAACMHPCRM